MATVGTALATFKRTAPQVLDEIDNFVPEGSLGVRNIRRVSGTNDFLEEVISVIPANIRNQFHLKAGRLAPYDDLFDVSLVKLSASEEYIRVFKKSIDVNGNVISNKESYWFMRKKDVLKSDGSFLTPIEIKNKFALPEAPTHYTKMQIPSNIEVFRGVAKEQIQQGWGNGGGIQFEFNQQPKSSWFVGEFSL